MDEGERIQEIVPQRKMISRRRFLKLAGATALAWTIGGKKTTEFLLEVFKGESLRREVSEKINFMRENYGIEEFRFDKTCMSAEILDYVNWMKENLEMYPPSYVREWLRFKQVGFFRNLANTLGIGEYTAEAFPRGGMSVFFTDLNWTLPKDKDTGAMLFVAGSINTPFVFWDKNSFSAVFHHELQHLGAHPMNPRIKEIRSSFEALNPEGQASYSCDRNALNFDCLGFIRPQGFAGSYGKTYVTEDMATIAGRLFTDSVNLDQDIKHDEVLGRKTDFIKGLYNTWSNGMMNDQYWNDLKSGKVNFNYWQSKLLK